MAESSGAKTGGAMRVDTAIIRELAELLNANELTEIEVEEGGRRIRVRRELSISAGPATMMAAPVAPAVAPAAAAIHPAAPEAAPAAAPANAVKSPMVGTAYLSAEPGGSPFVTIGQSVKAGDTLLIIEAMKVMNPITAPSGGVVRQLLVADAQPVEFDQPLVVIE